MKKLSIIIPCYNCEKTLKEAVDSCYIQGFTEDEFEIVMVDDKSTDNTYTLMSELAKTRSNIKTYAHERNLGGGATRNTAVANASADIIFCLDSDDFLGTQALCAMYRTLTSEMLDGVCFEQIKSFSDVDPKNVVHITSFPTSGLYTLEDLIERKNRCGLYTVFMFTKESFAKSGGYPTANGFDTQGFAWRFLCHGSKARSCPGSVYHHRIFTESYYIREYKSGKTNINFKYILLEHDYLLEEAVLTLIKKFNVRDFTHPLQNELKKIDRVFKQNAEKLTHTIPPHVHDAPNIEKPVRINSVLGIFYRMRHKLRSILKTS